MTVSLAELQAQIAAFRGMLDPLRHTGQRLPPAQLNEVAYAADRLNEAIGTFVRFKNWDDPPQPPTGGTTCDKCGGTGWV